MRVENQILKVTEDQSGQKTLLNQVNQAQEIKMKMYQNMAKIAALMATLAVPLAPATAQALALSQDDKIEGVIVSRDGDNLVMRGEAGSVTNVTVNKATKIDALKGLVGVRSDEVNSAVLVPGLKVSVEPEAPGKQVVAKSVQFHVSDLETANAIQAALSVPQQQIQALIEKVNAQEQKIAEGQARDAAFAKRMDDLADYDLKAESNIFFDINSATLSDKAKEELKALAAKAKSMKGYLIQVAGYADAAGNTSHNQHLSDRRAAAVASYLQQEGDIGISRVLTPIGMGVSKPVADNETAEGRAENRRVTVKIAVNRGISQ